MPSDPNLLYVVMFKPEFKGLEILEAPSRFSTEEQATRRAIEVSRDNPRTRYYVAKLISVVESVIPEPQIHIRQLNGNANDDEKGKE